MLAGIVIALSLFLSISLSIDVAAVFPECRAYLYGKVFLVACAGMVLGSMLSFAAFSQTVVSSPAIVLGITFVVIMIMADIMLTGNASWIAYELSDEEFDQKSCAITEDIKRGFLEVFAGDIEDSSAAVPSDGTDEQRFSSRTSEIIRDYDFSPRQAEVFAYLARGHKADYIADKLLVSPNTVRTHVANIYQKLNVHTQQELLDFFYEE